MIRLLQPWFLLPGVVAAVVVIVLHFLVRSPVRRAALPTLRFLSPAPRAVVRFRRVPHDLSLLVLRVLFALILAASFARPVWTARGVDRAHVLLLDRGSGMVDAWDTLIDSARTRLGDATLVILFDTVATIVQPAQTDSAWLERVHEAGASPVESDYRVAFHALARNAGAIPADSYDAVLITVPRWSAWRDGTTSLRRAAWPGALELVVVGGILDVRRTGSDGEAAGDPASSLAPQVVASAGSALHDAVESLGWIAVTDSVADSASAAAPAAAMRWPARIAGPDAAAVLGAGWRFVPDSAAGPAVLVFAGGWTVQTRRSGALVRDADNGAAIAAWRDGALAAATSGTMPCTIITTFDPDDEDVTTSPEYPELIRHLVLGCADGDSSAIDHAPLDAGALHVLRGSGDPAVRAAELAVPAAGRPLGTLLLLVALGCALVEWPLRRSARTDT